MVEDDRREFLALVAVNIVEGHPASLSGGGYSHSGESPTRSGTGATARATVARKAGIG